jgi:hypothetical protein
VLNYSPKAMKTFLPPVFVPLRIWLTKPIHPHSSCHGRGLDKTRRVMCPLSNSTAYIGHPVRKCTKEHRHLICPIYRFDNQNLPLWWAPLHVHNGPVIAVCTVLGPNFESHETPELMCFPFSSSTFFFSQEEVGITTMWESL